MVKFRWPPSEYVCLLTSFLLNSFCRPDSGHRFLYMNFRYVTARFDFVQLSSVLCLCLIIPSLSTVVLEAVHPVIHPRFGLPFLLFPCTSITNLLPTYPVYLLTVSAPLPSTLALVTRVCLPVFGMVSPLGPLCLPPWHWSLGVASQGLVWFHH